MSDQQTEPPRRSESLAARQARVGIIANAHQPPREQVVPREVWSKWPDMRSARRTGAARRKVAQDHALRQQHLSEALRDAPNVAQSAHYLRRGVIVAIGIVLLAAAAVLFARL